MNAIARPLLVCLPLFVALVGCTAAPETAPENAREATQRLEDEDLAAICNRYRVCWNDGWRKCNESCSHHLPNDPEAFSSCYGTCITDRDAECRKYAGVPDDVICGSTEASTSQ